MGKKNNDMDIQNAASDLLIKIIAIFEKEGTVDTVIAGVLGSIMGVMASQTEHNFPFVSFWGSFHNTYYANLKTDTPIYRSGAMLYEKGGKIRKLKNEEGSNAD